MVDRSRDVRRWLIAYSLAATIEGLIAMIWLALIPADAKNGAWNSFSSIRLALMGLAAAVSVGSMLMLRAALHGGSMGDHRRGLVRWLQRETRFRARAAAAAGIVAGLSGILLLLPDLGSGAISRLRPIAALLFLIGLQSVWLNWRLSGGRTHWAIMPRWQPVIRPALLAFGMMLLIVAIVLVTGVGVVPDRSGWYSPGTPVLFTQVLLAAGLAAALFRLGEGVQHRLSTRYGPRAGAAITTALILIGLWAAAWAIWMREPLQDWSYFISRPRRPNFELYPYSDAALYDEYAQTVITGTSRSAGLLLHALYVFFLAGLHTLAGQAYESVIRWQVPVLAVIPPLAFLVTSMLGGRLAGLMAAILLILRERNSIALTNIIEVSHSKLLMSDVPAFALVLLFVLVLLKWLGAPARSSRLALISGAVLGLLCLTRSQALALVPIGLLGAILAAKRQWQQAAGQGLLFLAGVALILAPWVIRNHDVAGRYVLDNTEFYTRFLASSYHTPQQTVDMLPGEDSYSHYDRMRAQMLDYIVAYPGEVAAFISSHAMHNEILSVASLPIGVQVSGLEDYVHRWQVWQSPRQPLSPAAVLWMGVSLVLIAVGLGAAVSRIGWLGLVPLAIHIGYSLSVAPARLSGWRFILPADWVLLVYYCLGMVYAAAFVIGLLAGRTPLPVAVPNRMPTAEAVVPNGSKNWPALLGIVGLLCLGAALPAVELAIPNRYPALSPEETVSRFVPEHVLQQLDPDVSSAELQALLSSDPRAAVLHGRALYPAFLRKGRAFGHDTEFTESAREHNRLQFVLTGTDRSEVYLPLESSPARFPHAMDVSVIGCREGRHVRALLIFSSEEPLMASPWTRLTCDPLPRSLGALEQHAETTT